jgi:hypothetical protein
MVFRYLVFFSKARFMREFVSLFKYANQHDSLPQMQVSYLKYTAGRTIFGFDYSPDSTLGAESGTLSLVKRGNIRLEVRFARALTTNVYMLVNMLTTLDIRRIMGQSRKFSGVYPASQLPVTLIRKSSGIIINLDEHWKTGSNWVAVYFPKIGPAYYFDSFGRYPPNQIIALMERNSRRGWTWSTKKLQDLSTLCGFYCIEFLRLSPNYNKFFSMYIDCSKVNDSKLLHRFMYKRL